MNALTKVTGLIVLIFVVFSFSQDSLTIQSIQQNAGFVVHDTVTICKIISSVTDVDALKCLQTTYSTFFYGHLGIVLIVIAVIVFLYWRFVKKLNKKLKQELRDLQNAIDSIKGELKIVCGLENRLKKQLDTNKDEILLGIEEKIGIVLGDIKEELRALTDNEKKARTTIDSIKGEVEKIRAKYETKIDQKKPLEI